jgi:hypothetical protein
MANDDQCTRASGEECKRLMPYQHYRGGVSLVFKTKHYLGLGTIGLRSSGLGLGYPATIDINNTLL